MWTPDEIRRTYGLEDESSRGVSAEKKEEVTRSVLSAFDANGDGVVSWEEWREGWKAGKRLLDFGVSFWIFSFFFGGGFGEGGGGWMGDKPPGPR